MRHSLSPQTIIVDEPDFCVTNMSYLSSILSPSSSPSSFWSQVFALNYTGPCWILPSTVTQSDHFLVTTGHNSRLKLWNKCCSIPWHWPVIPQFRKTLNVLPLSLLPKITCFCDQSVIVWNHQNFYQIFKFGLLFYTVQCLHLTWTIPYINENDKDS